MPRARQGDDPALRAGLGIALPFLARRMWVSLRPRSGAAPHVDYDPGALGLDPGVTWIGHATFHVRMDGASFLTDPVFSRRASPLSFAGPPRLVAPGVPLTDEPLDEPPARFLADASRRGLGDRAWVLRIGETRSW